MLDVDYVIWDFDGVINDSIVDGRFVWVDTIEQDLGISLTDFTASIFTAKFLDVITGKIDILAHIEECKSSFGFEGSAQIVLDYWLEKDARPDASILAIMEEVRARGVGNVIATNNEHKRASYIENEMGFGLKVERVFSSGRMGVRKPQHEFFHQVEKELQVSADRLILIDDSEENAKAAADLGWRSHHYGQHGYEKLREQLKLPPRL